MLKMVDHAESPHESPYYAPHSRLHILWPLGHLLYPSLINVFTQDNTYTPDEIPTTLA